MIEQNIVNKAIDKYFKLDEILRSRALRDEEAAFLRGRKHELMMLICSLDKQTTTQFTERTASSNAELVELGMIREVYLN